MGSLWRRTTSSNCFLSPAWSFRTISSSSTRAPVLAHMIGASDTSGGAPLSRFVKALLLVSTLAGAARAEPTEESRKIAHASYEQGKAAFEAHDYLRAGKLFLEAYARVPHHDPLWNAAR